MKTCEKCGCINDSINNYCRNCGSPFISVEQKPALDSEAEKPKDTEEPKEEISLPELDPGLFKKESEDGRAAAETTPEPPITDPKPVIDFDFGGGEEEVEEKTDNVPSDEKLYSTHPIIHILKKTGASGTYLTFCILFSAFYASVLYLLPGRNPNADAKGSVLTLFYVFILPMTLMLTGFWMHFAASSDRKRNWLSTGGLSLVRAGCIINIVICSLLCLVMSSASMQNLFYFGYYSAVPYDGIIATVITAVLILAVSALLIIYFSFAVAAVSRLKKCAATGAPAKLPTFIIVMNYIAAALISPGIGYFLATEKIPSLISVVLLILSFIFLSGVMINYRSNMRETE